MTTAATVLLPDHKNDPAYIFLPRKALRMAIVTRDAVTSLREEWSDVGAYVLVGWSSNERHLVYVGKAVSTSGLKGRLARHATDSDKGWWQRALLVADLTSEGFNSAQVGWLESELVSTLRNAPGVECKNVEQPRVYTLHTYDEAALRPIIADVMSGLRLLGVNPDTRDQVEITPIDKPTTKRSEVQLTDLLKGGLLEVGTSLQCTWQNRGDLNEEASVTESGKLLVDGQEYPSLSAAAQALRGGPTNGWTFWGVTSSDGRLIELAELREKLENAS